VKESAMYKVFFVLAFYLLLGAVGMVLANRKVDKETAGSRWLKYRTYVLITSIIFASIRFNFFWMAAALILVAGIFELKKAGAGLWVFVFYLVLAIGFFWFALFFDQNFQLFLYFQVMSFDAFSQITGQLIGRKRIGGKISPSKTMEGLTGGMFFCLLSALLAGNWLGLSWQISLLCGLITGISSFAGDMLASYYKRVAGIKDYSNLLPGQGGFLDRFDSFIFTGCFYMLLSILLAGLFPDQFNYGRIL
jgi:phosphatidate cytidylyltransferase